MTLEIKKSGKRDDKRIEPNDTSKFYKFRCFFSQFLATTVENMLLFDMGLCQAFPFLIIAALTTGNANDYNRDETLSLTAAQASWMGSVAYIFEIVGAIISAYITDQFGRKRAMLVVNIPIIVAWFMMYSSSTVLTIFIANILLGLGIGLMEVPILLYVGEICDPKNRGIMIAYTHVGYTLGNLFVSILNTLMPWRTVALTCISIPIITMVSVCFVPETPLWLLSRNRTADAEKSLRWLRGWVSKEAVSDEFQAMQRHSQRFNSCNECIKQNQKCPHPLPTMLEKIVELKRKPTLKPFFIVMALFFIASFSGNTAMMPFVVQIFNAYESPIEPNQAAALINIVNNFGNLVFLLLIKFTGKRLLYLSTLTLVFLCTAVICGYGFIYLPTGYNSFDQTQHFALGNKQLSYIPFVSIILCSFFSFTGLRTMGWQLMSELFPYKTRGTASALAASLNYGLTFIAIKTYYNFETAFSLPGITLFNCVVIAAGLILMYRILPETENRSLEDIELHFADNSKKLTDRKIVRVSKGLELGSNQTSGDGGGGLDKNHNQNGLVNRGFVGES